MKETIILHYESFQAVIAEMVEKHPTRIDVTDPTNPQFKVDFATHYIFDGSETLVAMYVDREVDQDYQDMLAMESINILGTYDEIFADVAKTAIYDRVYDQTPIDIDDGEGNIITHTPSRKFVVFAE